MGAESGRYRAERYGGGVIRHTVLIAFEEAEPTVVDTVVTELRALPSRVPEIVDYTVGPDLGLGDAPPTVVVIGDFATVDDWRAYLAHPEHVRVLEDHIRPHASSISRAQIEL